MLALCSKAPSSTVSITCCVYIVYVYRHTCKATLMRVYIYIYIYIIHTCIPICNYTVCFSGVAATGFLIGSFRACLPVSTTTFTYIPEGSTDRNRLGDPQRPAKEPLRGFLRKDLNPKPYLNPINPSFFGVPYYDFFI